jgi:S-DNA-T family DNA segregation ATPase FtsK/SpoIIIE
LPQEDKHTTSFDIASKLPVREIGSLLVLIAAILFALSIFSYSIEDRGFATSSIQDSVSNWMGSSGAYVSDALLFLIGWTAYLIPLGLVWIGYRVFVSQGFEASFPLVVIRASGILFVFLCASIILELHFSHLGAALKEGAGGILGQILVPTGSKIFGFIGLSILSISGFLLSIQAVTGFSWVVISEKLGKSIFLIADRILRIRDEQYYPLRDKWIERFRQRKTTKSIVEKRQKALEKLQSDSGLLVAPEIVEVKEKKKASSRASQKRLFDTKSLQELPDTDLLDSPIEIEGLGYSKDSLEAMSRLLELKLDDFGVEAEVVSVLPGPVVTRFELKPAAGVKVQRISTLAKDLARSMAVISVRIVEVIPGKPVVGIEIPNEHREMVHLKEAINSVAFQDAPSVLTLVLGKDISGETIVADLSKMPHLLIAGTTGSGKSVGVNAMLLSVLLKSTPEQVRLILVDPKMLELSIYEGIPHLLSPVVTDMREAAHALNWCVAEMERRYRLMAGLGVRNLAGFNRQVKEAVDSGNPLKDPLFSSDDSELEAPDLETLPVIVVVIDEFADMMMMVGKKVEQLIARIAQKARAAGIHLVLATQRPSVDVITGLIKANIPSRISFQVSSKVDSRTILDQGGAEQLLGHGDMLYLPPGTALPQRVHGAFVSDDEVKRVVEDWKSRGSPQYQEEILSPLSQEESFVQIDGDEGAEQNDELYDEAVQFVIESRRASISSVQRKLRIGYNRAARLIESMELAGVVSNMNSNGSREVLVPNRD